MKLGIFGDSFAEPVGGHTNFPELTEKAWIYNISNYNDVVTYGVGGASMFYVYYKFMEEHEKYDRIIVLAPNPMRYSENYFKANDGYVFAAPSYHSVLQLLNNHKHNYSKEVSIRLEALLEFYLHFNNEMHGPIFAKFMVEHIKKIRPDALVIGSCHFKNKEGKYESSAFDNLTTMHSYVDLMISSISKLPVVLPVMGDYVGDSINHLPHRKIYEYPETRCICHFSEEINEVVAKDMSEALETGVWSPKMNVVPHANGIEYYYNTKFKFWDKIING